MQRRRRPLSTAVNDATAQDFSRHRRRRRARLPSDRAAPLVKAGSARADRSQSGGRCDASSGQKRACRTTDQGRLQSRAVGSPGSRNFVQLQQVVLNLVINAVDATSHLPPAARSVAVAVSQRSDGFGELAVADNGHGLKSGDAEGCLQAVCQHQADRTGSGACNLSVHRFSAWRHAPVRSSTTRRRACGACAAAGEESRMSDLPFHVHLIDDDQRVLTALTRLLSSAGYVVEAYPDAESFLAGHKATHLAVRSSISAFRARMVSKCRAHWKPAAAPFDVLSGHGDIPASVRAMKAGALDFLVKPVDADTLLAAISHAAQVDQAKRRSLRDRRAFEERLARLTPRESCSTRS